MKHIVFASLLLFFVSPLFSQTDEIFMSGNQPADSVSISAVAPVNSRLPVQNSDKKLSVDMNIGTSVSASNGKYYSGYYVAPTFNYQVNPRLNIRVGVVYLNSTLPSLSISENQSYTLPDINYVSVFTEGTYNVSSRLTVSGSAYKQINGNMRTINPKALDYNMQGASVGFDYKISEGIHVGAQVRFQNSTNPYYNPYYRFGPYGMYPGTTGGW